jgi:uncharacterized membrane protein YuzA (DUF378 family)
VPRVQLSALDWSCFALLILGAVNWGVIGVGDLNVLTTVLTPVFRPAAGDALSRIVYALVGVAGLYFFYPLYRVSRRRGE